MGHSVSEILTPKRIMGVIKRIQGGRNTVSRLMGFLDDNIVPMGGRLGSYDIFNDTREIPNATAPEAPSHISAPQKVGNVPIVFPHLDETIQLLYEKMMNQRQIGEGAGDLDTMGLTYITRQEAYLAKKFLNFIEFQAASMLRGKYYYRADKDTSFVHTWNPANAQTVDFRIPAGNLGQLNMLGDGNIIDVSWDDQNDADEYIADIPAQLFGINAALEAVCGLPLEHIVLNSETWQYVIKNAEIKSQAGTANIPMEKFNRDEGWSFSVVLKSIPWVTWHVMDHRLEVDGTLSKVIQDGHIHGFPTPAASWTALGQGSQVVVEGPGQNAPKAERFGQYAHAYPTHNPAGYNLNCVYNGLPLLYVPSAMVDATVVF